AELDRHVALRRLVGRADRQAEEELVRRPRTESDLREIAHLSDRARREDEVRRIAIPDPHASFDPEAEAIASHARDRLAAQRQVDVVRDTTELEIRIAIAKTGAAQRIRIGPCAIRVAAGAREQAVSDADALDDAGDAVREVGACGGHPVGTIAATL